VPGRRSLIGLAPDAPLPQIDFPPSVIASASAGDFAPS
jgi:hypothetical protein